ncbi:lipoma-preferred partner homolog isoform X2 [Bradysia coprophila]|uniref:lipoma-preferred partner homolog isoform X2 n=1 Tax=Bradysia coprophila TaxID=38358 RepID=UPI00187DC199|nr:lipoma-preferred partner homolog isoform X2 [Bradysia coprophila]
MDDLEKQLQQLQMLNNRDLSPKPSQGLLLKKVAPEIPPKPKKNQKNQSQSPSSSTSPIICEPSYSQILQAHSPAATIHNNDYINMKLTLDNPAVLEQKLEALEHHKRVLENQQQRRLQLQQKGEQPGYGSNSNSYRRADGPVSNGSKIYENQSRLYENMKSNEPTYGSLNKSIPSNNHDKRADGGLVYSNIMHGNSNGRNGSANKTDTRNPYSNMTYDGNLQDDLPPPPPMDLPPQLTLADNDYHLNHPNEEELPPPPSPVSSSYSSSYSELRRATGMPSYPSQNYQHLNNAGVHGHHGNVGRNDLMQTYANSYQPDYGYVPSSQGSTTYESLYEPINPRPPSQLSSRSNYSLYTPYVSGPQGGINGKMPSHKEAEVDVLTDLLVQSMDNNQDIDSYGTCVECGERVVGENSGCTAMEQIYHIKCFTCCQCQMPLQGKPFYAFDGKPCCEEDYLNTLEKCSVCMKPILERILRATGKPYHPHCFCCVVCGKSLDGVPFTVDATNQNHCIEDFHKKFAPRCCVCREPIMPEPGKEETVRVVALDRSFHVSCYKCEDCGLLLSSEAEGRGCFPLDDHILCKSCNAKRVQALTSHMTTEL